MRLGLFGGSFDPVHYGHLLLAEYCREQAQLDQVLFMPAAIPPHKQEQSLSAADDRVTMLELAVGGQPAFVVSRLELDRGGVSYTVDTLRELQTADPQAELFLLLGADSLADLPNWREPAEICRLATPLVVRRRGVAELDYSVLEPFVAPDRVELFRRSQVEMPVIELASREIRRRVSAGASIRYQTPRAVEKYISSNRLYRGAQLVKS